MLEENLVVQRKAALESGAGVKSRLQAMEIAYVILVLPFGKLLLLYV